MKHRSAVLGMTLAASLLGGVGVANATHRAEQPNYSPCRPEDPDETRLGYSDAGGQDDPQKDLPTIYAEGSAEGSPSGHIGICGGGGGDEPDVQYVEVGNDNPDGELLHHSDPPAAVPAASSTEVVSVPGEGAVNVGGDYVEIDGTEGNTASGTHPWLDGYASAGLREADGGPGICASGDNDHAYYQDEQPQQKDCNEELLAAGLAELEP